MRLIIALGMLLSVSFAFAQEFLLSPVQQAPYYVSAHWPGEYPEGYELVEEIIVYGYSDLNVLAEPISCTLSKGSVIHPWAKKTKAEFAYFSPVKHFVTTQDYKIGITEEINLKAGETILELSYLSEGVCTLYVRGKQLESECLENYMDEVQLVSASPFTPRRLFKTQCQQGSSLWIDAIELEFYLGSGVKYAEINGYAEVLEP